jgi:hypothetical protein
LGVDQVVVVQHQQRLAVVRLAGQLVDQGGDQPLERRRRRRPEQRDQPLGQAWSGLVQGGDHVAPEPGRVAVAGVQRQPGHRPPVLAGPVGQQDGLAEPGRGADQHQSPRQRLLQPLQ